MKTSSEKSQAIDHDLQIDRDVSFKYDTNVMYRYLSFLSAEGISETLSTSEYYINCSKEKDLF